MDSNRVKQILGSKENIEVLYNGSPVWIEGISDNGVAEVTALTGSRQRREVPVNVLIERK